MKPKKMVWIGVFLAFCIGLGLFVVPAQARNVDTGPAAMGGDKLTGELLISVQHVGRAYSSTTIVLYDQDWNAVDEVSTRNSGHRFTQLKTGGYHVVAYREDIEVQARADAEVQSAKTAVVSLKLEATSAANMFAASPKYKNSCAGAGLVSGDGNLMKIAAPFENGEIVYRRCGRIVAVYNYAPSCSCKAQGWRYVVKCDKPKTIYVNLPCKRN